MMIVLQTIILSYVLLFVELMVLENFGVIPVVFVGVDVMYLVDRFVTCAFFIIILHNPYLMGFINEKSFQTGVYSKYLCLKFWL